MPSNGASSSSSNRNTNNKSSSKNNGPSNYQLVKQGWGDRPAFQASYVLGMDPDSIEEGNAILDAFRDADAGSKKK